MTPHIEREYRDNDAKSDDIDKHGEQNDELFSLHIRITQKALRKIPLITP